MEEAAAPEGPATYTMADVETHNTAESCWVVVEARVFDLTAFAPQHPGGFWQAGRGEGGAAGCWPTTNQPTLNPPAGGPNKILNNCGTDLTAKFAAKHGLESMQVGVVVGGGSPPMAVRRRRLRGVVSPPCRPVLLCTRALPCLPATTQADILEEYYAGELVM